MNNKIMKNNISFIYNAYCTKLWGIVDGYEFCVGDNNENTNHNDLIIEFSENCGVLSPQEVKNLILRN